MRTRYAWRVRAYAGIFRKVPGLRLFAARVDIDGTTTTHDEACNVVKAHVSNLDELAGGPLHYKVQIVSYLTNYSSHGGIDL